MTDPTHLRISLATPGEAGAYAHAAAAAFFEAYRETSDPENMDKHLAREFGESKQRLELTRPGYTVLVSREPSGEWAGFAALQADARADGVTATRPMEIVRFYLREHWYGRGAARPLMQAALAEARARGHDGVWLQVWEHNARARRFYETCGFRAVGTNPFLFGEIPEDDIVYQVLFDGGE